MATFIKIHHYPSNEEGWVNLDSIESMRRVAINDLCFYGEVKGEECTCIYPMVGGDDTNRHYRVIETPQEIMRLAKGE